ncbi:hypothetical protein P175DRAFT_0489143 [Aspergillus ochraceoroseus IBT 24754]|uniref:Uncharacterized protein n=2 Tax=Aspergillus ochraceoroseus TaxID=138278 RepID=A0A2T5M608_9EURO|nr:uncharacterized protein P175DRAFT_0489143 [Aspergillus ochraceoroseus IBT 24754]KKK12614.1 hypothetical protein AOCH_002318 [Aspergillus ochraceoroseus]PTU23968.1 hypothetical protein P175DRAFT_0489143 [Aspergillus ochraceoroseus IBT 24754]
MPSQTEQPAFQSSSSSSSLLSSSTSRSTALYSGDRDTQPTNSSSCDVLLSLHPQPVDALSLQPFSLANREDMAREGEQQADMDLGADSSEQRLELEPRDHSAVLGGNPVTDETLSAFMAVPRYPNVVNNDPFVPVSEVVNAVIEHGDFFRPHNTPTHEAGRNFSPPVELYMSDSEMTDTLSELGGVSLIAYPPEHVGMAELVNQFVEDAPNPYPAISDGTEEDSVTELAMEDELDAPRSQSALSTALDDDLDDTRKFYGDHGDSEYDDTFHPPPHYDNLADLSDVDFGDFYRGFNQGYGPELSGFEPASHEDYNNFLDGEEAAEDLVGDTHFPDSLLHGTTQERNFNIDQFISQWLFQSSTASIPILSIVPPVFPQNPMSNIIRWSPPAQIIRPSGYTRDFFDLQQIPWWEKLRVKRADARHLRDQWYTSYHNLQYTRSRSGVRLSEEEFYFQGKAMYTEHRAKIEHFQLRNVMSVPAYNTVHFSHESKVYSWAPAYGDLKCLIDLSMPVVETGFQGPVKISTMKTAQGMTIAGGFFGEYGMRAAGTEGKGIEGFVTKDRNGITNHIDIIASRTNRSPVGVFASNDCHIRVLDCETNTFLADHELSHAVNCTSTSPDGRLRVVIGDSADAWVVEADTGRPVHPLRGHRDFGFACAWSPDMRQIATSNQDKTAMIWDARTWKMLEKIESDVAGYRSLRFSPVGGGPRTLMLCEPADRVVLVNAQTYQTRQVHDFFGEIGGADYSPDGSTIWIANTDEHFGGFMEYDRRQWGQRYGLHHPPNEWVKESELDEDERCLLSERERQMRFWWNLSEEEHEGLLL